MRSAYIVAAALFAMPPSLSAQGVQSHKTLTECVDSVRTAERTMSEQARKEGKQLNYREWMGKRNAMLKACKVAFPLDKLRGEDLLTYANLSYSELREREGSDAGEAINRLLAEKGVSNELRAKALILAAQIATGGGERPTAEQLAKSDAYLAQLDALPDTYLEQKIAGHSSMLGYYRGYDIGSGMDKQARALVKLAQKVKDPMKAGGIRVRAYTHLAEVFGDKGQQDSIFYYLDKAKASVTDTGRGREYVEKDLESARARYALIGKAAPSVAAEHWINAPERKTMDLKGKVTLLEFTAHW
jgi:hypothetical protein